MQVARQIAVPTNDNQVRAKLREHGEAICLFGETVRAPDSPRPSMKCPEERPMALGTMSGGVVVGSERVRPSSSSLIPKTPREKQYTIERLLDPTPLPRSRIAASVFASYCPGW